MERGPHVFLSYEGADRLAREIGLEQVENNWFVTGERRRQLDEIRAKGGGFNSDVKYGTVGAVAVDAKGHVAAATSTGGLTAKQWGRIGNSPLIGAGTCDDARLPSASTGGESISFAPSPGTSWERVRLAGQSLQDALDSTLEDIKQLGPGGLIAVSPSGACAWGFTTNAMYRGVADAGSPESRSTPMRTCGRAKTSSHSGYGGDR